MYELDEGAKPYSRALADNTAKSKFEKIELKNYLFIASKIVIRCEK